MAQVQRALQYKKNQERHSNGTYTLRNTRTIVKHPKPET